MNTDENILDLNDYLSIHDNNNNFLNLDRCLQQPYTIKLILNNEIITKLSLAYNYLIEIPKFISDYTNLIELNVSHNELYHAEFLLYRSLDNNEFKISRPLIHPFLQSINLSFNHLKFLPLNLYYLRFLHTIDLSYNYLDELPNDIGYLEQLHTLILNNNNLKFLPNTFIKLKQLKYLNLSFNQFQTIDIIKNFFYLKFFSINSNPLKTFPILLNTCENLEEIFLSNISLNQISNIKFNYFNSFSYLKKLDLSQNNLNHEFFLIDIQSFNYLEELYLQNNQITNIYSLLSSMKSLYLIDLTSNSLIHIPECLNINLKIFYLSFNNIEINSQDCQYLKFIQELELNHNHIQEFPNEFLQCINLQILNISNNKFKKFPEILFYLHSLNKLIFNYSQLQNCISIDLWKKSFSHTLNILNLSNNNLHTNLCELTGLKTLIYLDLSSNQLYELHQDFRLLTCLKVLKLNHNKFNKFPNWLYQMSNDRNQRFIVETLLELHMNNNQIKIMPEEIVHMISLHTIDLSNNQFSIFPEPLVYLEQLISLHYSQEYGIYIDKLPDDFIHLSNLKYLDLSHNTFYEIPQMISNLIQLEYLNMSYNLLNALNINQLNQLKHLKEIKLNGNNFSSFPSRIYQYEIFDINENSLCLAPPNDYIKKQSRSVVSNLFLQINDEYEEKLFQIYKHIFIENLLHSDLERFLIRLKLSEKDMNYFRKNSNNLKHEEKIEILFHLWKQKRDTLANSDTLYKLAEIIGDKKLLQQMKKAYLLARTIRI